MIKDINMIKQVHITTKHCKNKHSTHDVMINKAMH